MSSDLQLMTCRICGESTTNQRLMVKFGVRHYAHHECYLSAGKLLTDLHDWQVVNFPWTLLVKYKLTDAAEAANKRIKAEGRRA